MKTLVAVAAMAMFTGLMAGCEPTPCCEPPAYYEDATREQRLQMRLDAMAQQVSWGVAAGVTAGDDWYGAAGWRDASSPVSSSDRFRVASITKIFTATLVLQLVDEGVVSLDAPLSVWVPEFPNAQLVTLRQLLSHTSGIPDYDDPSSMIMQTATQYWSPDAIAAYVGQFGLQFVPGTSTSYSNTNYILLGMVIERASGTSYAQRLHERILDPLQLHNTGLDGFDGVASVPGYDYYGNDLSWSMHPSVMWSAGAVISDARDLATFVKAVYTGELFSASSLHQMTTTHGDLGGRAYGLGTILYYDSYGPAFGHNGSLFGYSSHVTWRPAPIEGAVVLLFNTSGVNTDSVAGGVWDEALHTP